MVSWAGNVCILDNWKEDNRDVPLFSNFLIQIVTLDNESPFMQLLIAFPIN